MNKILTMLSATVCVAMCSGIFASDTSEKKPKEYVIVIPAFEGMSIEDDDNAAKKITDPVRHAIDDLQGQLRNAKSNDAKTYIIYLLGRLRAQEAVGVLIEMIDFRTDNPEPAGRIARWGSYPVVDALVAIGGQHVQVGIAGALLLEKGELRRKLMVMVLVNMSGAAATRAVIEGSLPNAKEPQKANIRDALKYLEEFEPRRQPATAPAKP